MRATTFFIETHGCQMNDHDSEKIGGLLRQRGMNPVTTPDEADLYLLNTCSIREKAAQKVYSRLGELRIRKERDPGFVIGVVGCVAQQEGEDMVKKAPYVDLVVGTHLYHEIPDILDEIEATRRPGSRHSVATEFLPGKEPVEIGAVARNNRFRANVTIMEGCNKRCAFCIVPFTRGKERNRPSGAILSEIGRAVDNGYLEVQLLGQTVNSYRDPARRGYGFADLLADVARIAGLRRIRFTSPHPRHFTDDVIANLMEYPTICNHVHLPLQSGSSNILRRMRRQHDREWYLALVGKFRSGRRPIALSTDIIVGFPGETERDFEDTLSVVREVRFEQMFSFKYSPRPYTEAFRWEDDIPEDTKQERLLQLQRTQRAIQLEIHQRIYLGREFSVLTEGTARDGRQRSGRTATNKIVNFPGSQAPGELVQVRITGAGPNSLQGEPVCAKLHTIAV